MIKVCDFVWLVLSSWQWPDRRLYWLQSLTLCIENRPPISRRSKSLSVKLTEDTLESVSLQAGPYYT